MPTRFASRARWRSSKAMSRRRAFVASATAFLLSGAAGAYLWGHHDPHASHARHASATALDTTYLPLRGNEALRPDGLARADGSPFPASGLEGRWTLVFFGFTSCPDVCPTTLDALSRAARDPAMGMAQGRTQVVFVSVDPERDTPARLREYLQGFDARIVGLRGPVQDVKRFGDAIGAGFARDGTRIDHSTSVFVVAPDARLAGVLLRPSLPARIAADLASLQRTDAAASARAR